LTDEVLEALTSYSSNLEQVTIIDCPNITDRVWVQTCDECTAKHSRIQGIIAATINQKKLRRLELRNLDKLTSQSLEFTHSPVLHTVDLSGCHHIGSEGIFYLVCNNPSIRSLCLNNCVGLDDQALYDIGYFCAENLHTLGMCTIFIHSRIATHTKGDIKFQSLTSSTNRR